MQQSPLLTGFLKAKQSTALSRQHEERTSVFFQTPPLIIILMLAFFYINTAKLSVGSSLFVQTQLICTLASTEFKAATTIPVK